MSDRVVRALLPSHIERTLTSQNLAAELRQSVLSTEATIRETREVIRRSDQLIHCISKAFGGAYPE